MIWLSGRRMGTDLAASTELSLCREINRCGHEITLVSPGKVENQEIEHIPIPDIRVPGLTSIIGSIRGWGILNDMGFEADMIIVDWRYIFPQIAPKILYNRPWMVIDRGPPTRKGLLNGLQKRQWSKAWVFANSNSMGGFVVSEKHGDFVKALTDFDKSLHIVNAGSYPNPFENKIRDAEETLVLAYIGQIDKRRDVESIFALTKALSKRNIKHRIDVCGSGDLSGRFESLGSDYENIKYHGILSEDSLFRVLSKAKVGIMPMPDIPVWRISSTLKLANYLASGLAVIGPLHPGNGSKMKGKWNLLSKENWIEDSSTILSQLTKDDWTTIHRTSLESFESLSWNNIGKKMCESIEKKISSFDHSLY